MAQNSKKKVTKITNTYNNKNSKTNSKVSNKNSKTNNNVNNNAKKKVNPTRANSKKKTNTTKNNTSVKTNTSKKTTPNKVKENKKVEIVEEAVIDKEVETKNKKNSFISKIFSKLKLKNKKATKREKVKNEKVKKEKTKKQKVKKENKNIEKKDKKKFFSKSLSFKKKDKKSKIKKVKEPIFSKKSKKVLIVVAIICLLIIIGEGIFALCKYFEREAKTIYYDSLNGVSIYNDSVVAVGSSSFKYSRNYNYTNGVERGKLLVYDVNGKLTLEKMYKRGIATVFNSVLATEDGYIVVGTGIFSKEEQETEGKEAFIIKYDKKGKIVWEKFYQVITNTSFNKVIETEDGYIAIGQSIYANMELGNHTTGGGIIVKYDKNGNQIWQNNHGGTKSGNFNDIVEVGDSYYVVGKDGADSANLVKFSKDGKYLWHKNYSYTDGIGFTGITYLDNNLYVVGSKKILPKDYKETDDRNTSNTDALLVKYDLDGNIIKEKTFGGSNFERYNSIVSYNNSLYVIGHVTSDDCGLKISTDGELMTGILVRYDSNLNITKKEAYGGSNNDNLTDIATDGVSIYVTGYSNSGDGNIKSAHNNNKDYFGKLIKLDLRFRKIMVK